MQEKKGEMQKLTVEVPRDLWRRAKVRAAESDTDLRSVVIAALEEFLSSKAKGGRR